MESTNPGRFAVHLKNDRKLYSCVNEDGNGREIIIQIEDGVTSSLTIKKAIEDSSEANELVETIVYGSVAESVYPISYEQVLPRVLRGGKNYVDKWQYNLDGVPDVKADVIVKIAPKNNEPDFNDFNQGDTTFVVDENTEYHFNLTPANDPDYLDSISYRLGSQPENGIISGCMDLEGSEGANDLSCIFTPSENYVGSNGNEFSYTATDDEGNQERFADETIVVRDINDLPVICQYSTGTEAPECGSEGCFGKMLPSEILCQEVTQIINRLVTFRKVQIPKSQGVG